MITQFDKMAEEAMKWEKTIVPAIQAIVDQTEAFANEMTNAIGLMNEAIDLSDAYLVALHSSRKEVGIEAPYDINRWTAEQKWKAIQQYEEAIDNGIDTDLAFESIIADLNVEKKG